MRFELDSDGDGTLFSFLDTFSGATNPLTLPWTASVWHGTVDALERTLTGRDPRNDFGLGGEFYWRSLRDFHRFSHLSAELASENMTASEWREAYLVDPL